MEEIFKNIDKLFKNGALQGIITIVIYIILILAVNKIMTKVIKRKEFRYREALLRTKSILLWTLLFFSVMSQLTFMQDIAATVLAGSGIVAVVVGLASQEAAGNIVSGMMIFVSKPFKVGDTIILKEYNLRGKVNEVSLSHSVLETLEKNLIMVPNTIMNKAIIENLTYETEYKIAYLSMDVSYESDLEQAGKIMKEIIMKHPLYLDVLHDVPIHCIEFKDSSITLRAKITTKSVDDSFQLCSDCRISIKKAFDEAGIEIPYPHLSIQK